MPRNCSTAICLLLALCITTPCFGAVSAQERRIRCGEYSYILPEGFTAFDMPQPSNTNDVYLMTRDNPVGEIADAGVTCIIKQKVDNAKYILETVNVFYESPRVKHAIHKEFIGFDEKLKQCLRVYHEKWFYENIHDELQKANWSIFCVEMNSYTKKEHVILFFWTWNNYKNIHVKKENVVLTDAEIKDRAFKFIHSIK